jgi:hypothetical protein
MNKYDTEVLNNCKKEHGYHLGGSRQFSVGLLEPYFWAVIFNFRMDFIQNDGY